MHKWAHNLAVSCLHSSRCNRGMLPKRSTGGANNQLASNVIIRCSMMWNWMREHLVVRSHGYHIWGCHADSIARLQTPAPALLFGRFMYCLLYIIAQKKLTCTFMSAFYMVYAISDAQRHACCPSAYKASACNSSVCTCCFLFYA